MAADLQERTANSFEVLQPALTINLRKAALYKQTCRHMLAGLRF